MEKDGSPKVVVNGKEINAKKHVKFSDLITKINKFSPTLLVIIILTVSVFLVAIKFYDNHSKKQQIIATEELNQVLKKVSSLRQQRKDYEAKKTLDEYLTKHPKIKDQELLSRVYTELSAIYVSFGDYKNAQSYRQKVFDNTPDKKYTDYLEYAESCKLNGDKQCAITNYKKALTLMNSIPKTQAKVPLSVNGPLQTYVEKQIKILGG